MANIENARTVLAIIADIIESTYEHDEEGNRIDGDSPVSAADVVDRLLAVETGVWQAIKDLG